MKILDYANQWVGKLHKDTEDMQPLCDIYNSQKPLPRGVKAKITSAYCAIFATVCGIQAGSIFTYEMGAWEMYKGERAADRFRPVLKSDSEAITPRAGDLIFYKYPNNYHVGIVESYKDGVIHTIEGNIQDGQCLKREVSTKDQYILGYSTPVHKLVDDDIDAYLDKIYEALDKIKELCGARQ